MLKRRDTIKARAQAVAHAKACALKKRGGTAVSKVPASVPQNAQKAQKAVKAQKAQKA